MSINFRKFKLQNKKDQGEIGKLHNDKEVSFQKR